MINLVTLAKECEKNPKIMNICKGHVQILCKLALEQSGYVNDLTKWRGRYCYLVKHLLKIIHKSDGKLTLQNKKKLYEFIKLRNLQIPKDIVRFIKKNINQTGGNSDDEDEMLSPQKKKLTRREVKEKEEKEKTYKEFKERKEKQEKERKERESAYVWKDETLGMIFTKYHKQYISFVPELIRITGGDFLTILNIIISFADKDKFTNQRVKWAEGEDYIRELYIKENIRKTVEPITTNIILVTAKVFEKAFEYLKYIIQIFKNVTKFENYVLTAHEIQSSPGTPSSPRMELSLLSYIFTNDTLASLLYLYFTEKHLLTWKHQEEVVRFKNTFTYIPIILKICEDKNNGHFLSNNKICNFLRKSKYDSKITFDITDKNTGKDIELDLKKLTKLSTIPLDNIYSIVSFFLSLSSIRYGYTINLEIDEEQSIKDKYFDKISYKLFTDTPITTVSGQELVDIKKRANEEFNYTILSDFLDDYQKGGNGDKDIIDYYGESESESDSDSDSENESDSESENESDSNFNIFRTNPYKKTQNHVSNLNKMLLELEHIDALQYQINEIKRNINNMDLETKQKQLYKLFILQNELDNLLKMPISKDDKIMSRKILTVDKTDSSSFFDSQYFDMLSKLPGTGAWSYVKSSLENEEEKPKGSITPHNLKEALRKINSHLWEALQTARPNVPVELTPPIIGNAKSSFDTQQSNEITINKNDLIMISHVFSSGKAYGHVLYTDRKGIFPLTVFID